MATDEDSGGYDYNFVDEDAFDKYICHICTLVARDPYQVSCCSNIYCQTCLQKLPKKGQACCCPTCREPLNKSGYFKDGRADREIGSLLVHCSNKSCRWQGSLKEIDAHLQQDCFYQRVPCTNGCGKELQRRILPHHLKSSCDERLVKCRYCKEEVAHRLIATKSHLEICPDYTVQCTNEGCEEMIARRLMISHEESCPKVTISCEYSTVGCNKRMRREEQEEHNEHSMKEHLQLAVKRICTLETKLDLEQKKILKLTQYSKLPHQGNTSTAGGTRWYSPSFYASKRGYKMMLGVDTGSHVSCYIFLTSGEHDDTLEWPFQGEVTIELLNQLQDDNHWTYVLHYNERTPVESKQRNPKDGWGCPEFISQSELGFNPSTNCQYLKDDALYFRVSVKVTSNTKPWLVGSYIN